MKQITYIKTILIAAVIAALAVALIPVTSYAGQQVGTKGTAATTTALAQIDLATTVDDVRAATQGFLDQYNLTSSIVCTPEVFSSCSTVDAADLGNTKLMASQFVDEWSKYPPAFIATTNLTHIDFVDEYAITTFTPAQSRAAGPINARTAMLYSVNYATDSNYMRKTVHHEFAHYLDFDVYGDYYYDDTLWKSYNPAGFTYGAGGSSCYTPGVCPTGEHAVTGFATGYATAGIEEDKAEVLAYLFDTDGYTKLSEWIKTDTVLAQKVLNYKNFLKSITPSMDARYFAALHSNSNDGNESQPVTKVETGVDVSGTNFGTATGETLVVNGKIGDVQVVQDATLKGTGTVGNINLAAGSRLAPGLSPGCISSSNLTFVADANYDVEVAGSTVCTEYDQTRVTGTVTLNNAILNIALLNNFRSTLNQKFTIIDNDSTDAVTGTFKNLVEGAEVVSGGTTFKVSYIGGDGNDVTLEATKVEAAAVTAPGTPATGIKLMMANPAITAIVSTLAAGSLLLIARRYSFQK